MNQDHPKNVVSHDTVLAFLLFLACLLYALSSSNNILASIVDSGIP